MDEKLELEAMCRRYKNVFGSPEGRSVLSDILTTCHFGETLNPENPTQVSEYNTALVIAHKAGVFDLIYRQLGIVPEKE